MADPFDPSAAYSPDPRLASIQHIFVIMQENHAYDNYFGAYCRAVGPVCSSANLGLPPGVCIPYSLVNLSLGCAQPYPLPTYFRPTGDLPHNLTAATRVYDGGRMDGFLQVYKGNVTPLGYYDSTTVSAYWDLAEEYGLGDYFFSPALGASIANHWVVLAGGSPSMGYSYNEANFVRDGALTSLGVDYLNEANATPTLVDRLQAAGVPWRVYDYPIPVGGYQGFLDRALNVTNDPTMTLFDEFDPIVAKASTFTAPYASHFSSRYALITDASTGNLPAVSWVFPDQPLSEHPGGPALYNGEHWVTHVIDAIENSSAWSSCVIFFLYDEYGGWYDHAPPPGETGRSPGFRVPFLVIGPNVREGFIDSQFTTSYSILQFIEDRFGLGFMGPSDQGAASLLPYFDFTMAPRDPLTFTVNESYPAPLQAIGPSSAAAVPTPPPGVEFVPPSPSVAAVVGRIPAERARER